MTRESRIDIAQDVIDSIGGWPDPSTIGLADVAALIDTRCPLAEITWQWRFDDQPPTAGIERCGGDLHLDTETTHDLADPTVNYTTWKVICSFGHVVVIATSEDGPVPPVDPVLIAEAIACTAIAEPRTTDA